MHKMTPMIQDPIEFARYLLAHKHEAWIDSDVIISMQRVIKQFIPIANFEARTVNRSENGENRIYLYLIVNDQFIGLHGENSPDEVGRSPFLSKNPPGSWIGDPQAPERRQEIERVFISLVEQFQLDEHTPQALSKDRLGPRL